MKVEHCSHAISLWRLRQAEDTFGEIQALVVNLPLARRLRWCLPECLPRHINLVVTEAPEVAVDHVWVVCQRGIVVFTGVQDCAITA